MRSGAGVPVPTIAPEYQEGTEAAAMAIVRLARESKRRRRGEVDRTCHLAENLVRMPTPLRKIFFMANANLCADGEGPIARPEQFFYH